jgi:hypothetical protein
MSRFLCTKTNQATGWWAYKGTYYDFSSNPDTDYFTAEVDDEKRPGSDMGLLDRDGTFYFGRNIRGWDDLRFPMSGARLDSASTRYSYDYTECTVDFNTDARYTEEPTAMVAQMPHSKMLGSAVCPHLHWVQQEANVPNWLLASRCYNNGDLVPAFNLTVADHVEFAYASGNLMQMSEFPAILAPDNEKVSAIFDLILYRDSANASTLFAGADPYTVAAKTKEFDLHYLIDSLGSGQEGVK